jgi:Phage protein Gp138 N-terminal domain
MSETNAPPLNANPVGAIADPGLRNLFQSLKDEIFWNFNCHEVGIIAAFDPATQQAQVQIMVQRVVFNQVQQTGGALQITPNIVDYPILVNCPVFCMTGGGCVVTMPVAEGDPCLLLFNDRDIDVWFSSGSKAPPNTARAHDLSDGFALVGFRNMTNLISGYSSTAAEVRTTDNTGKVSIAQAISQLINATEVKLAVGTTVIDLTSQVGIQNATTSLKTVMDMLFALLTAWTDTHGDTPNPTTLAAIAAAKTQSDALLK